MTVPTRAARIVFALLVVGGVASFFVAQRLKNEPPVIGSVRFMSSFSPNGDGRKERITFGFHVKRTTPITVEVVSAGGGAAVRTLAEQRTARAYRRQRFTWDGRDEDGRVVEGRYRLKITLTDEGRSVALAKSFTVDVTPPRPRVRRIVRNGQPPTRGPALLPSPDGEPLRADLVLRGWYPTARVVRTAPGPVAVVRRLPVKVTREADGGTMIGPAGREKPRALAGEAVWDGRLADGRAAEPGTYVLQVCVRDQASNLGCGPTASTRPGQGQAGALPTPEEDGTFRGRGGITVRPVGVQPSLDPVDGNHRLTFFVDARGRRYHWVLRRIGDRREVARGSQRAPLLRPRTGSGRAAGYLLAVSVDGRDGLQRVEVPALATDGTAQRVLVVLPAISWIGGTVLDDDGDGQADTLDRGPRGRVRTGRVMTGLPEGFADVQAVLERLRRDGRRYDLTTDLALASGAGPRIEGHRGVLLVGEHRWTTAGLSERLQRFVRGGGTVAVLDPASLHRTVERSRTRLLRPGRFTAADAFGIESEGAVRLDGPLQIDQDDVDLFDGTDGRFDGYPTGWPATLPGDARRVAGAVDGRDRSVILAARIGRGLVVRTGLPTFAQRLDDDDTSELMSSTWRRLSR